MRYNVTFNQLELMAYNEKHPKKKIDFKDAIILQQLWHLSVWEEVEKIKLKDGEYFWGAYGKLNAELPCLGFKSKTALGKRIKARLLNNDLLRLHIEWKDNSKTYWQFTEAGLKIAEPGKDPSRSHDGTRGGGLAEREGVAQMNERGSSGGTNNYNTIDHLIKNYISPRERETFLKIHKEHPLIFNSLVISKSFHERIEHSLKSEKLKSNIQKDIIPVILYWIKTRWIADDFDKPLSRLRNEAVSYVLQVIKNGGLATSNHDEKIHLERPKNFM